MVRSRTGAVLTHLLELAGEGNVNRLPDRELLQRFVAGHDQKAQAQATRRRPCAPEADLPESLGPLDDLTLRELRGILHEEMHRLPEQYRAALLLCYWEGLTHEAAARRLGWKKGTLKERVERARALLRARLARRGLAPSAGRDGTIRRWDASTGKELLRLEAHRGGAYCVALSPDGKTLASGGADRSVRLWDATTAKELHRLTGHLALVASVAFSPDGKLVASGASDQTVRLWQVASGKEVGVLRGHEHIVRSVAFAPDGRTLASGGMDNIVRLWDVATGKETNRHAGHQGSAKAAAYSPDGGGLASASWDTSVLVWQAGLRHRPAAVSDLPPGQAEQLWADLARIDSAMAYDALCSLAAAPRQAVPLVRKHLRPAPAPDPKVQERIAKWLTDLDSERHVVREQATKELEKLGEEAEPALRKALEGRPPLEVRRRVENLLKKVVGDGRVVPAERLRLYRAIELLEQLGTPQAREVLEALSRGAPEARVTQEARAALGRWRSLTPATREGPKP